jgi:hypothetical protein
MAGWGYGLLGPLEVRVNDRAVRLLTCGAVPLSRNSPAGRSRSPKPSGSTSSVW